MTYEVLIPPPTRMLVPLEQVYDEFGLDPDNLPDEQIEAQLSSWVERATSTLERLTGRPLILQTVREYFTPTASLRLSLRVWPVVEVLAVRSGDAELDTDAWAIEDKRSGILIRTGDFGGFASGMSELAPLGFGIGGVTAEARRKLWSVDYRAGYHVEDIGAVGEGETPLPDELADLALEIVRFFRARARRDPTLRSESIGDWSATYALGAADLGASGLPIAIERRAMAYGTPL